MKKSFVFLAVSAAAVALSGCGSNQALGLTAPGSVLAAITATTNSPSSKIDVDVNTSADGQNENITGTGEFNYTDNKGQITLNVPASGSQAAGTLTEIIVDKTLYAKGDQDQKWAKVDLTKAAQEAGFSTSSLNQNAADPTQGLNLLKGSADNVTKVGKETLRGTKATHYKASLDFDKAASSAKGDQQTALQKLAAAYNHQTIPADVWVDSKNRIRKLVTTVDLSKLAVSAGAKPVTGTVTTTEELYDFGTSVNVSAPPADQVQDVTGEAADAAKQQTAS